MSVQQWVDKGLCPRCGTNGPMTNFQPVCPNCGPYEFGVIPDDVKEQAGGVDPTEWNYRPLPKVEPNLHNHDPGYHIIDEIEQYREHEVYVASPDGTGWVARKIREHINEGVDFKAVPVARWYPADTSPPVQVQEGAMYYNTHTGFIYMYIGGEWVVR